MVGTGQIPIVLIPEPTRKWIIARASAEDMKKIAEWIEKLDKQHMVSKEYETVPLGYADGYPRSASNRGYVLLRGQRCPIIGVVCMDHMMIDATGVPEAAVDDEVLLLGQQGNEAITANQLAQWAGTVVHEVPTVIGRRVKRVYLEREQQ